MHFNPLTLAFNQTRNPIKFEAVFFYTKPTVFRFSFIYMASETSSGSGSGYGLGLVFSPSSGSGSGYGSGSGSALGLVFSPSSGSGSGSPNTEITHGGNYVRYNLRDDISLEVSSEYVPPLRLLGRGAYGIVCAATNEDTEEEVAIKKIWNAFNNVMEAKRALREIKILRLMDHDNIIAIKDVIRPPEMETFNDVYIVYELMDTDLYQLIHSDQKLTDGHCQCFIYQVLKGLKYIHSANVLHRDLKPSNLFVNVANFDLKIGDFGLARTISEKFVMSESVVTRWYRAPELLLCSDYGFAIDVWSVGCILAEIITKKPLFPGENGVDQLKLILQLLGTPDDTSLHFLENDMSRTYFKLLPRYPKQQLKERLPDMSPLALDLLGKMLVFDPDQRITVDEALCHPYFTTHRDINNEPICSSPLSFDFEEQSVTVEYIKELILNESLVFNPDPAH